MKQRDRRYIANEIAMLDYGRELAGHLKGNELIFLVGEIGMGKTTLARGLIGALGYSGRVKSPTYTLVETYAGDGLALYHFDFYRIENPDELDFIGFEEMLEEQAIKLVEWPERASGKLPSADIIISISESQPGRTVEYAELN
ncbi:MAG: tRNA (adenosine(37)-N6)-threonylcarbamoyltransferase complex ATPase subunit type 1 TsaE [Pseudomonadales bacterium]|nr:tRNA (adenosine(37)-N6)-threonylcarbamoyltransferase complex ATPase subunit type 1 TsaE [Pseudomonadales bacterium]